MVVPNVAHGDRILLFRGSKSVCEFLVYRFQPGDGSGHADCVFPVGRDGSQVDSADAGDLRRRMVEFHIMVPGRYRLRGNQSMGAFRPRANRSGIRDLRRESFQEKNDLRIMNFSISIRRQEGGSGKIVVKEVGHQNLGS